MGTCEKHGQYSTFCKGCDMDVIQNEENKVNERGCIPGFVHFDDSAFYKREEDHQLMQKLKAEDHYKFIEKYGKLFASHLNIKHITDMDHFSACDGDKTRQYKQQWHEYDIPLCMGTMVYFLSKEHLFCDDVRQTDHGWVPVEQWVISVVLNLPKVYEGEHYDNIRKAYNAVIKQYCDDQAIQV